MSKANFCIKNIFVMSQFSKSNLILTIDLNVVVFFIKIFILIISLSKTMIVFQGFLNHYVWTFDRMFLIKDNYMSELFTGTCFFFVQFLFYFAMYWVSPSVLDIVFVFNQKKKSAALAEIKLLHNSFFSQFRFLFLKTK